MGYPYPDNLMHTGIPWEAATKIAEDSPANFRNLLDGGDFTVNPFQRNIAGLASGGVLSSAISNTPGYFADRWFGVGGASSSIVFAAVGDTNVKGFSQSLTFGRSSGNTNTAAITMGQVLETGDSIRCQGQPVTLSFWARPGANYSGGNLTAQVVAGDGTNQSAANLVAGSWTTPTNVINQAVALTSIMQRYAFTGFVPVGTTQLGVLLSYAPTGTAGSADNIIVNGLQLEIGTFPSAFEHRDLEVELGICQRFAAVFAEPASGVVVSGAGMMTGSAAQQVTIPLPTTMRSAPTVTVSAGTFKFNVAGTATAVGAGFAAGATHTPTMITLVGTVSSTGGQATALQGGGGSGYVIASADF